MDCWTVERLENLTIAAGFNWIYIRSTSWKPILQDQTLRESFWIGQRYWAALHGIARNFPQDKYTKLFVSLCDATVKTWLTDCNSNTLVTRSQSESFCGKRMFNCLKLWLDLENPQKWNWAGQLHWTRRRRCCCFWICFNSSLAVPPFLLTSTMTSPTFTALKGRSTFHSATKPLASSPEITNPWPSCAGSRATPMVFVSFSISIITILCPSRMVHPFKFNEGSVTSSASSVLDLRL